MSNIHNEQLFTELTPAEGANVTGGATYCICNKTQYPVNYNINGKKGRLEPRECNTYSFKRDPVVIKYDSKIGPGYKPVTRRVRPGSPCFDIGTGTQGKPDPGPIVR